MLLARFFFGAGEAGAFPGIVRATFSWIPMKDRGFVQSLNFSGSRIGAAIALPLIAVMVDSIGWRASFITLMLIGFAWAVFWCWWFRDDPTEHKSISDEEREMILANRQQVATDADEKSKRLSIGRLLSSKNVCLLCIQYFASNFTFFFVLSWMFPLIKSKYELTAQTAGMWTALPFIGGAFGCWTAGLLIDRLYKLDKWVLSRRAPAIAGFILATGGMLGMAFAPETASLPLTIGLLTIAIFGADMTLPPSWSSCIDIGKKNAGVVSGTMNMAGNIGSASMAIAYPYLKGWTNGTATFFFIAASLNALAVVLWFVVKPNRNLEDY
jgi:MFS transporter, ACS family, glucarate transporter